MTIVNLRTLRSASFWMLLQGLSTFERSLAREINFRAEHMPGNINVRRLMGRRGTGARVTYGESLFFTWSPNEQQSALVLRIMRNRANDTMLSGDAETGWTNWMWYLLTCSESSLVWQHSIIGKLSFHAFFVCILTYLHMLHVDASGISELRIWIAYLIFWAYSTWFRWGRSSFIEVHSFRFDFDKEHYSTRASPKLQYWFR